MKISFETRFFRNNMKRIVTTIICLTALVGLHAQNQKGDTYVYPRIGFAIANLTDNEMYYDMNKAALKSKSKAGLTVGVEVEHFLMAPLSISAGLTYANRGYRYGDFGSQDTKKNTFWNSEDTQTSMHYLQLPVMVNFYVADGLALKAGLQPGYLVKAKDSYHYNEGVIDESEGYVIEKSEDVTASSTDLFHLFDVSIPVGVSYEYLGFVLDLRYHFGLTNTFKVIDKSKNSMVSFTLGYQFKL